MKKNVSSKDPRKPNIVAHLKAKSGGNKVTLLTEYVYQGQDSFFEGKCLRYVGRKYEDLGFFQVYRAEIDKKPLDKLLEKIEAEKRLNARKEKP